ncbi:MAG TPA: Calx-beta domain-containing protein [Acidimicrobiia bacterium]|nr:Calx-beta domain-containing protein [Acidimicrobiia bacterium]
MQPSRRRAVSRWSLAVVLSLLGAVTVGAAPAAHAANLGTVTIAADSTATEPGSPTSSAAVLFKVVLTRTGSGTVTVDYQTADGSATAGLDYAGTHGTLVFSNSETTKWIPVSVFADALNEPDEDFTLQLTSAANATVGSPTTRTGVIVDVNARPAIGVADTAVGEGGGKARFLVTLSNPSANTVTVNAATADLTATAGSDYTAIAGQAVTFNPGEVAKVVTVDITDDNTYEGDEAFALNLSSPSNATVGDGHAVATIADNETVPTVSIDDTSVVEGDSGTTPATFTVHLDHPSATAVTVEASTADGTAAAPGDYTARTSVPLTIAAGSTSTTVDVTVKGDSTNEADETFSVTLANPSGALLGDATATGTIKNDDGAVTVSVVAPDDVVEGNAGLTPADFTVSLNHASGQTVTVDYATSDGTAQALLLDYVTTAGTLSFAPGETQKTVSVPVVGDLTPESAETFDLDLSNPNNATVGTAQATATILNDDGPASSVPTVTIQGPSAVTEGNSGTTNADFTLTLTNGLAAVVAWATDDSNPSSTATAGADYASTSGVGVNLAPNVPVTIHVPVIGDTVDEADETFSVKLTSVIGAIGAGTSATATIADDDAPPVLSVSSAAVAEGKPGAVTQQSVTVSLSPPSGQVVTVAAAVSSAAATAGTDYTAADPGTLTFQPGETSKTVTVEVLGDAVDENDEAVSVTLSSPAHATLGTNPGTITITDDDAPPVVSVAAGDPVGEADGEPVTFTVSLNTVSAKTVDVTVATTDGTALAGADYTAVGSTTLHFLPGERTKTVDVAVLNDAVADSAHEETFTLDLTSPANATLDPSARSGTGTILDDDGPAALSINNVSVAEGNSGTTPATFTVKLVPAADAPVTVHWATADGTATAPGDYAAGSGTLAIPAGETGGQITVNVAGDTVDEIHETFSVTLSSPSGAVLSGGGTTLSATGTIIDDDAPVLWITAPAPVTEGNSATTPAAFVVHLSTPATDPVTVDYATANGTSNPATAGSDYTATSGTATLTAGQTAVEVDVPVVGDTTDEVDETFTVTLSNPGGALLSGTAAAATGTINDDDGPTVSVSGPASVNEGNSGTTAAAFTVTLSGASVQTVTVDYTTVAGTATSGTDYTPAGGTLTFAPSAALTQTVNVAVIGDTIDETDEGFSLTLSNAVDGTLGTATAATTIVDDDGPAVSVAGPGSVVEGDSGTTNAAFTVSLSAVSPQPVTVHYATVAGTATSGVDYTAAANDLTIPAGSSSATVNVAVKGDTTNEADETFALTLSAPQRATLGTSSATATIVDDDTPGSLTVNDVSVVEGTISPQKTATFTVTLSPARPRTVTVNYGTVDGTATAPADYTATSGTLTFAPGETTKSVAVPIRPDVRYEPTEHFTLHLSSPVRATLGDADGLGTITDDDGPGYLLVGSDGASYPFGATTLTAGAALTLSKPIVGAAATPSGQGYWEVASDGGIFAFGDAAFYGSTGGIRLNKPIVGMAATPSGNGYWLVASDGGIFAFGDATFYGSTGSITLNRPIVGMAGTPSGKGYWFVASDGGVFAFGDAGFYGSTGSITLNKPIVGMTATATGHGYWMTASDGGIFSFGDAGYQGSTAALTLGGRIVAMVAL